MEKLVFLGSALYLCSIFAATAQVVNMSKDIVADQLSPLKINLGSSVNIFDKECNLPAIYLKDNGTTYTAQWLSVVPPKAFDQWPPYLQTPTPNSIVVSWKTSTVATPAVAFGTTQSSLLGSIQGTTQEMGVNFYYHSATLTGLTPDTRYYYKITGDETLYSFRTQPEVGATRKYKVLLLGDHQIIDRSGYEWLINAARETVQKKYGGTLEDNIDLVLNPGDQVDQSTLEYYERCHFYKSRSMASQVPVMTTLGNHEFVADSDALLYQKFFAYEKISYKEISSKTDAYYAFQSGRTLFVVLCTEAKFTTDATQLNWLKSVLAAANADETVDFVISMCHRPMNSESYITDFSPWLRNTVVPELGKCPKHTLNIAAHHHYYQRGQVIDFPFFHIISGGASWDQTWAIAPNRFDDNLTQKTFDYWTYQIIEFDPATKQMNVESYSIGNKNIVHNNILIDKFTRDLNATGKPEKPSLEVATPASGLPTFISSPFQAGEGSGFNSCHFQLSESNDFKTIAFEKINHVNNYFGDGGAPNYIPVNTQAGVSNFEYTLKNTDVLTGVYYVRVRHRNADLSWSDWSEAQTCAAKTADETYIALESNLYGNDAGTVISVSFGNAPVGKNAWVSIYAQGVTPGGSVVSVKWAYVRNFTSGSEATGNINFTGLAAGKYFVTLFEDGGYIECVNRIDFTVVDQTALGLTKVATLKSDKTIYNVGEAVNITYKDGAGKPKDWIAVWEISKPFPTVGSNDYKYVQSANLKDGLVMFSNATKMPAGNYIAAFLSNDGYVEMAPRIYFTVAAPAILNTTKETYLVGENVIFEVAKLAAFPLAWLTLKEKTTGVVKEKLYLNTKRSNCTLLREIPAGEYLAQINVFQDERPISNAINFSVIPTSRLDKIEQTQPMVYPNPVADQLYFNALEVADVQLYDQNGRLIFAREKVKSPVSLQGLGKGHYQIVLSVGDNQYVTKFIKK